jgi:hypothetical protein
MNFVPGDRIRFVYTGQEAEVISVDFDGMLSVRTLPEGEVLPAFAEDVVALADFRGVVAPPMAKPPKQPKIPYKRTSDLFFESDEAFREMERRLEAKETAPAKKEAPTGGEISLDGVRPIALGPDSGLHLLFRAVPAGEEVPVYLLNDTNRSFGCTLNWLADGARFDSLKLHLPVRTCFPVTGLSRERLGARLEVELEIPVLGLKKTVRIKPKNIFAWYTGFPQTDFAAGLLTLADKLVGASAGPNLAEYARSTARSSSLDREEEYRLRSAYDPERLARFPKDIDLHIEKLVRDPAAVSPADALRIQLAAFEDYLREAIELGVPSFHVIHGLGTGRLRQEVENRLRDDPYVRDFHNGHHPNYGFGATEVFL